MGFYIQGPNNGKLNYLIQEHHAREVSQSEAKGLVDEDGDEAVVCVVMNGPFDAAALAFNPREFEEFVRPDDTREKYFLSMDKTKAHLMAGYHG